MIDTFVFDFGGVLIDWNPRYVFREIFDNEAEMEWFLSNVCTGEWNGQQDKGRTLAEGTALLKKSFPQFERQIEDFYGKWENMLGGEFPDTVAILKELKGKYKLFGLTNWSAETFPVALERFTFLRLFEGIVVSGAEKMIKPDRRLFRVLLDRYNLKAENCVYIDDSICNAEAADELGFYAIHFTSAGKLKEKLDSLGLL
jgi:2-haloacid dehalogenase